MTTGSVVWQGTPMPWPTIRSWGAILAILLGIFALLYWYMVTTGRCVDVLIQIDCTDRGRRGRIEVIFIVLAVMAIGALAVILRTALGFPLHRYIVTSTEVRRETGWPLASSKTQPLAYVSVTRQGESLSFTGAGEKPVSFDHLPPGAADRVASLIHEFKAAESGQDVQGPSV